LTSLLPFTVGLPVDCKTQADAEKQIKTVCVEK
jgi:hypothetical protein